MHIYICDNVSVALSFSALHKLGQAQHKLLHWLCCHTRNIIISTLYIVRLSGAIGNLKGPVNFHLKLGEDKITIYQNCGARRDTKLL